MGIRGWITDFKQCQRQKHRDNGYAYAAASLLKDGSPSNVAELEAQSMESQAWDWEPDEFDLGIRDALWDWKQMQNQRRRSGGLRDMSRSQEQRECDEARARIICKTRMSTGDGWLFAYGRSKKECALKLGVPLEDVRPASTEDVRVIAIRALMISS